MPARMHRRPLSKIASHEIIRPAAESCSAKASSDTSRHLAAGGCGLACQGSAAQAPGGGSQAEQSRQGRPWTASFAALRPSPGNGMAALAERNLPGKVCETASPRLPEQLPAFRALSRRSPQLKAAIREGAAAASPVVKDALAWLREALRPQPVLAPRANAEAETFSHHFEHALAGELRRGGRVLAIAGVIAVGWAGLIPLSGAVIVDRPTRAALQCQKSTASNGWRCHRNLCSQWQQGQCG